MAKSKKPVTSSSEILLIEATTLLKLLSIFSALKSSIPIESHFWEETTNPGTFPFYSDKSQLCMDFTTKSTENMEIQIHGNTALRSLITFQLVPLLTEKHSAFTEAWVHKSRQLTKLEPLIEKLKFRTKDHSVTWCGQILKTLRIGP